MTMTTKDYGTFSITYNQEIFVTELNTALDNVEEPENKSFSPPSDRSALYTDLILPIYPGFLCSQNFWMRPIFAQDWAGVQNCFFDPDNMQYFGQGVSYTESRLREWIDQSAFRNLDASYPHTSSWTLITHTGMAGCFWAIPTNETNTTIELIYAISASFSGKGLTTSAGKLVMAAQLEAPNFIGTIMATAHPNNIGSQCVLRNLGLKPDPTRQNVPKFGSYRNFYEKHVAEEPIEKPKQLTWHYVSARAPSTKQANETETRITRGKKASFQ